MPRHHCLVLDSGATTNMRHWLRRQLRCCKELILFIPVIWKLYTWDFTGLLIVMEHWLGRMKLEHASDRWHSNHKVHVHNIHICQQLCRRLADDRYDDMFYNEHDKRWGKPKHVFIPTGDKGMSEMRSVRLNVRNDADKELEWKERRMMYDHCEKLWRDDLAYLFTMFRRHLRKWWT